MVSGKELIIRELAKQQAFGFRKLTAMGASYGITIPMTWVKWHCAEVDGDYYLKLIVEGDTLIMKPITDDDLTGITIKRKGEL